MKWLVFTVLLRSAAVSQQWISDFTEQAWPSDFSAPLDPLEFYELATRSWQRSSVEFSKQVARLVDSTRISEERLRAVPHVLQHLESLLNTHWPGSRVILFGSIEYGLAMTGSDADCSIFLPHRFDTSHVLITEASNTLRQYPKLFADLFPVIGVRVPVVSFKHIPTQFKVDLTINNFNGIQISNLLRYLLHLDSRIYNLSFIVKQWAANHNLTDIRSLPNYGLILMVIFYLQQRNMMPSIASLQTNAKPFFENDWNMGFCEVQYEPRNAVPLNMILGGFFEYYVDFNYDKYIISPYAGYPIEKRIFADIDRVPYEFGLYVYNVKANVSEPLSLENAFVLQDVFIHNSNIAKYADTRLNSTFLKHFQFAAKKFQENNYKFLDQILLHGM